MLGGFFFFVFVVVFWLIYSWGSGQAIGLAIGLWVVGSGKVSIDPGDLEKLFLQLWDKLGFQLKIRLKDGLWRHTASLRTECWKLEYSGGDEVINIG